LIAAPGSKWWHSALYVQRDVTCPNGAHHAHHAEGSGGCGYSDGAVWREKEKRFR
jgi:hypothetical protein